MGYKIFYEPIDRKKYPAKQNKTVGILYMAVCAVMIVMLLSVPKAKSVLKRALIPGDPVITERAAADFMEGLRAGTPFSAAATAFCLEILDGAETQNS